jgi:predicted RNA-binding protein YlqC (UPF0109 family)
MSEIDQQFIEYVVKSLVGKPDAVHIDRRIDEKGVLLELTVDPEDLGRVIGKRGATAQSLRTLLRALGTKNDARYNLKIIDNGTEEHKRSPAPSSSADDSQPSNSDSSDDKSEPEAVPVEDDIPATASDVSSDEPEEDSKTEEDKTSDRLKQAREELADLDDLDV